MIKAHLQGKRGLRRHSEHHRASWVFQYTTLLYFGVGGKGAYHVYVPQLQPFKWMVCPLLEYVGSSTLSLCRCPFFFKEIEYIAINKLSQKKIKNKIKKMLMDTNGCSLICVTMIITTLVWVCKSASNNSG